jgi:hypothetical protein
VKWGVDEDMHDGGAPKTKKNEFSQLKKQQKLEIHTSSIHTSCLGKAPDNCTSVLWLNQSGRA